MRKLFDKEGKRELYNGLIILVVTVAGFLEISIMYMLFKTNKLN